MCWPLVDSSPTPYNTLMSNSSLILTAVFFLYLAVLPSCQNMNSWPSQALTAPSSAPAPGKGEAIGFYSSGCLKGAVTLDGRENCLELAHLNRGRFWGHPYLIDLLTELGEFTHKNFNKRVIVGDLSLSRGGPTVGGHSSHQNGLDADIWFKLSPRRMRSFSRRETEQMPSALKASGFNKFFSKPQKTILSFLAQDPRVARIFVHPRIKKEVCLDRGVLFNDDTLTKIRPWYGHDDHLHLRLKCPDSDKSCISQEAPKTGSGCDELAWWDSDEAKQKEKEMNDSFDRARSRYVKVINSLPEACQVIYK
jgi:penicillin-insensitive murein endopeptidase